MCRASLFTPYLFIVSRLCLARGHEDSEQRCNLGWFQGYWSSPWQRQRWRSNAFDVLQVGTTCSGRPTSCEHQSVENNVSNRVLSPCGICLWATWGLFGHVEGVWHTGAGRVLSYQLISLLFRWKQGIKQRRLLVSLLITLCGWYCWKGVVNFWQSARCTYRHHHHHHHHHHQHHIYIYIAIVMICQVTLSLWRIQVNMLWAVAKLSYEGATMVSTAPCWSLEVIVCW